MNPDSFPPEALALWAKISEHGKQILVTNVWCGHCQTTTTILNFSGQVVQGDLVISGVCSRCGGKVARLIESD